MGILETSDCVVWDGVDWGIRLETEDFIVTGIVLLIDATGISFDVTGIGSTNDLTVDMDTLELDNDDTLEFLAGMTGLGGEMGFE